MKLLPCRTPFNYAPCSVTLCKETTRRVHVCLAVTCHLHLWQNDRDLLHSTAVTREWNGYRNKTQRRKLTMEKKSLLQPLPGLEPATFRSQVWCSTTEFFRGATVKLSELSFKCLSVVTNQHYCLGLSQSLCRHEATISRLTFFFSSFSSFFKLCTFSTPTPSLFLTLFLHFLFFFSFFFPLSVFVSLPLFLYPSPQPPSQFFKRLF